MRRECEDARGEARRLDGELRAASAGWGEEREAARRAVEAAQRSMDRAAAAQVGRSRGAGRVPPLGG